MILQRQSSPYLYLSFMFAFTALQYFVIIPSPLVVVQHSVHSLVHPSKKTSQEKYSFHHASTARFCGARSVGRNELGKQNILSPPCTYFHCRHVWFPEGQNLRMAKSSKAGAGLL